MKPEQLSRIIELAKSVFVLGDESYHGVRHWEEVAKNGEFLSMQPQVDATVVKLFAYLHDCKRVEEYADPEHGHRAAEYVDELRRNGELGFLTFSQYYKLKNACELHHTGGVSDDPTIGACFDADRIELIRCGIQPRVELMSTPLGKRFAERMNYLRT
jgi:uncharacterized protein